MALQKLLRDSSQVSEERDRLVKSWAALIWTPHRPLSEWSLRELRGGSVRVVPVLSAGIHRGKLALDVVHGEAGHALPC